MPRQFSVVAKAARATMLLVLLLTRAYCTGSCLRGGPFSSIARELESCARHRSCVRFGTRVSKRVFSNRSVTYPVEPQRASCSDKLSPCRQIVAACASTTLSLHRCPYRYDGIDETRGCQLQKKCQWASSRRSTHNVRWKHQLAYKMNCVRGYDATCVECI